MNEQILAEHYQKTFELTLLTWEKRNRTFLTLLGVVGVGTLLTFNASETQPFLVDWIANITGITDAGRIKELRGGFPYGLIQSILLIVVAYLTVILYHRTATIQRFYRYLSELEKELRDEMGLTKDKVSFTRESTFYELHRPKLGRFVAGTYIVMLGGLLLAFLGYRIYSDWSLGTYIVSVADTLLAIPSVIFFYAYARSS